MSANEKRGTAFSTWAWNSAKQSGCQPGPKKQLPTWPPQFLYPQTQSGAEVVLGDAAPFAKGERSFTDMAESMLNERDVFPSFVEQKYAQTAPYQQADAASSGALDVPIPTSSEDAYAQAQAILNDEPVPGLDEVPTPPATPSTAPSPAPPAGNPRCSGPRNLGALFPCIWNTLQGVIYDLGHWKSLPSNRKFAYVFSRDDRGFYLASLGIILFLLVFGIVAIGKLLDRS